jgi:hypothetical protein
VDDFGRALLLAVRIGFAVLTADFGAALRATGFGAALAAAGFGAALRATGFGAALRATGFAAEAVRFAAGFAVLLAGRRTTGFADLATAFTATFFCAIDTSGKWKNDCPISRTARSVAPICPGPTATPFTEPREGACGCSGNPSRPCYESARSRGGRSLTHSRLGVARSCRPSVHRSPQTPIIDRHAHLMKCSCTRAHIG